MKESIANHKKGDALANHAKEDALANHAIKKEELQLANEAFLPEVIQLLNEGHSITLPLRGYSMRPFLEDNRDKALLVKTQHVKVGDAVLAEVMPGRYVLHRVASIKGQQVVLRGDGNLSTETCLLNNVKAVAIGFYRKGRNRLDSTNDCKWKIYSWWWTKLLPCRRLLLALYRHAWLSWRKPI